MVREEPKTKSQLQGLFWDWDLYSGTITLSRMEIFEYAMNMESCEC